MSTAGEPSFDQHVTSDANLLSRLDRAPVTRSLAIGIAVVVLVWLVESFDIGLVSTVILVLKPQWNLSSAAVGMLGASATIGLVIGIFPAGRLADLVGRKTVLIVGTAVFSLFTIVSAFSTDITQMVILRIIAGLGEGAIFPIPYMMISELVNKRARGKIMGYAQWVLNGGYTLPALVGLWSVHTFSPAWSWRVPLIIGGAPLLLLPALARWVPESPRYLLKRAQARGSQRERDTVRRLVERIEAEAGLPHSATLVDEEALQVLRATASSKVGMRHLVERPYLGRSAIAYCALTASFVLWYTMLTYAPTIWRSLGAGQSQALIYTAVMMFVSAFGVYFQGRWADSYGRKPVFAIYIVLAALGMVFLPTQGSLGPAVVLVAAVVAAWFGLGSFAVSKMFMAEQYPTRLRGFGTATGEMISRGLTGGVLVYFLPALFAAFGVPAVMVAAAILMVLLTVPMALFGRETRGRNMEELGAGAAPVSLGEDDEQGASLVRHGPGQGRADGDRVERHRHDDRVV
jgi:MFS transporter, putative metabolite:H+ symporter